MDSSVFKSYIYVQSGSGRGTGRGGCYKYALIVQIFCHSRNLQMWIWIFFLLETVTDKKGEKIGFSFEKVWEMKYCCPSSVLPSLLHSWCYEAPPLLRHLHGHRVVCYTAERWLVLVVVLPAGGRAERAVSATFWKMDFLECLSSTWQHPEASAAFKFVFHQFHFIPTEMCRN